MSIIVWAPQGSGMGDAAAEAMRAHFNLKRVIEEGSMPAATWAEFLGKRHSALIQSMDALFLFRSPPPAALEKAAANSGRVFEFHDVQQIIKRAVAVEA